GGNLSDTAARTTLSLVTSSGAAGGVTLSFSGQTGFFDATNTAVFAQTPFSALMDHYVLVSPASGPALITATFGGLTPGNSYRLLLYSSSNNVGRDTIFTVNGSSETVRDVSGSTTFQNGLNYADFTTTADSSGALSFTVRAGQFGGPEG